jgi:hypothetical protein
MGYLVLMGIGAERTPSSKALLTRLCNKSAPSTNRSGDKGSPCQTPLLHLKGFPGTPFSKIFFLGPIYDHKTLEICLSYHLL